MQRPMKNAFIVVDPDTYDPIPGAFVLLPERDSAARVALSAYAEATRNIKLARFIRLWLKTIHDGRKLK